MTSTRYTSKISRIRTGGYRTGDFILADAKDSDVTGGITTTGSRRNAQGQVIGHRTRPEFLAQIKEVITQDTVDILLASAGNLECLMAENVFDGRAITPAFRANETTDVWANVRGASYAGQPSRPYRGARLDLAPARLCLYSITFLNDTVADVEAIEKYADFRREAQVNGIDHFLEVFNPNIDCGIAADQMGSFVTDCILRLMASLTKAERPEFLKVAYNGPKAMEELASYDPELVVGVLGGAGATHRDTFELIAQSEKYGARLALFGRKINQAEDQCQMITWMRRVADRAVTSAEAVAGYHADLQRCGLTPDRALADDQIISNVHLRFDAPGSAE